MPDRVIADIAGIAGIARDRKEKTYDEQHGCEERLRQIKMNRKRMKNNEKQGEVAQKSSLK